MLCSLIQVCGCGVVEDLRVKVFDPQRTRSTIDLWREHVEARAIFIGMSDGGGVRRYIEWTEQDAVLVAMTAGINVQTQEYLAAGIAQDGYPTSVVIPLPEGDHQNTSGFRITDGSTAVPAPAASASVSEA